MLLFFILYVVLFSPKIVYIVMCFHPFTIFSDLSTHLEKLKKCFLKCREFGISLNLEKCAFMVFSGTILGFTVSKEGKIMDPKKVKALINMPIPTTPQQIQVFNGMAQFYMCFIKKITSFMTPITKLFKKFEVFEWTTECQIVWEEIKNQYVQALILISLHWELEFHVHIDASPLAI